MDNSKIITFILVGEKDDDLIQEISSTQENIINYGNAIILRGTAKFILLMDSLKNDFQFRLIIHYGLSHNAQKVGRKISAALKDKFNITLEYFTREPCIFKDKNKLFTMYEEHDKSEVKIYNFDEMNTESFIDQLPTINKKDISKPNNTTEATMKQHTTKHKIFIGSSTDGLEYAEAIKGVIENDKSASAYDVDLWVDVFGSDNSTNIEVLEKCIDQYKYSIFVFSPDDTIKMSNSEEEKKIPRDNCIFEYGLFMGKNGRPNTFFIVPKDWKGLRIISDADGMNRFPYTDNENKDSAVRTSCKKIVTVILKDLNDVLKLN